MKNKLGIASVLALVTAVLAVVAAFLYKSVMYQYQPVYTMLYAAAIVAVLGVVIATKLPKIASYVPIALAVLMASAAIWGTQLMVNQIGYVIAGLDGVETIITYIYFVFFAAAGMLISIIASFLPMAKPVK